MSKKREAAVMRGLSALAAAQPEEIRTRRTAAEQTYSGILNRLGAEGTYEKVGGTTSLTGAESPGAPQEASIFKTEKAKSGHAVDIDRRYMDDRAIQDITRLDPDATIKNVEKSAQFRIASRLTAESEQLLAREGELYDEMEKNLQLPILEGSAAMARENASELKRMFAKGGSARRAGFEAVQRIRSQERINSARIQAISQERFKLDEWSRENARTNLEFGQNWASNVGGVRESFNTALDKASELMLAGALPIMVRAQQSAMAARQAAHAENREKVGRWVSGIVSVVGAFLGGAGAILGSAIGGAVAAGTRAPSSGAGGAAGLAALPGMAGMGGVAAGVPSAVAGALRGGAPAAAGSAKKPGFFDKIQPYAGSLLSGSIQLGVAALPGGRSAGPRRLAVIEE